MFQPLDLTGKKIFLTGATSSIGRASAIYLSKLGASLVLTGRNEPALAETFQMLVGDKHHMFTADLNDLGHIPQLIENSFAADGKKFNGVLHCAGGGRIVPLKALNIDILKSAMQVNFYAFIEIIKIITNKKYFKEGSIVGVSSHAAMEGEAGQAAYSAAKAAMDAAVRALAHELAPKNIRINTVRPGMIESDATSKYRKSMDESQFSKLVNRQLLGLGQPEAVASMCSFLLSDASCFLTGRSMYVDGGRFN
ncbi:SDR family NAD(P)-dependent oxidoreductase [Cohnella sp.]|uniref:SDR family NAD(P)-dependent oxidoreductase n=1 Tax=Cohnella sp. TaxID=1883426 RepID=UPI0037037660